MFVCFEAKNLSLENKFSNLKRKLYILSPVLLNRAAFLRTSRADSTTNLEGRSGATSFNVSPS